MSTWETLQERLSLAGQGHVLAFWDRLSQDERTEFRADLSALDLDHLAELARHALNPNPDPDGGMVEPLPQVARNTDPTADAAAKRIGEELLANGQVAAFVVAGGQGTRLGHPGPKGTYPATPIRRKSLFQVFAEKLRAAGSLADRPIPWFVMTSPINHDDTVSFFEQHRFFGLNESDVMFFAQGTMPAIDTEGRLILERPGGLFRSPDGHGGSLRALHQSGALERMAARGIEQIFYFQVDNPLVVMCDPVFLGYHQETQSDFSSKVVPKRSPDEKVGILVNRGGRPGVIEYSDLPRELREAKDPDGQLRFRAGNIATHVLRRGFVEELNRGRFRLPYHVARKEIPGLSTDGAATLHQGIKFETFVFDALPIAQRIFVMEVDRREEFSPIKNRDGADSPSSSARDQSELHRSWLRNAGVGVADDDAPLEISPLFADGPESLARVPDLPRHVSGHSVLERP